MRRSPSSLGDYLRGQRINAGLSQAKLAKKLGYTSAQFVSNWERRISTPPLCTLKKLVTILKLDRDRVIDICLDVTEHSLRKAFRRFED